MLKFKVMLVDVITGLPDAPELSQKEADTMRVPTGCVFSDIDIKEKKGVYILSGRLDGKKLPKRQLSAEEAAWVDYGVADAVGMAARLNREVLQRMAAAPVMNSLF